MTPPETGRAWLWAIFVALLFCAGYPAMYAFRRAWQTHYPNLASQWANNGRFAVLGLFGTESNQDELAYAARAKEASLRPWPHDPFIKGFRSPRQAVNDALTYAIMGAVIAVVGDMNGAWILMRFLCCVAWFVLLHKMARKAGARSEASLFAAAFVTCFSYLLTFYFLPRLAWTGHPLGDLLRNAWTTLSYGRTESVFRLPRPGISYAFSFAASLLYIAAAELKSWRACLGAGLLGGALAYVRADVWTSYVVATSLDALLESIRKPRGAARLWFSLLVTAVLSAPYLYFTLHIDPEFLDRSCGSYGRRFDAPSLVYLAVAAVGWWKARNAAQRFLACMAGATFVMVNISLVLGYATEPWHWKLFGNIYVFLLLFTALPEKLQARSAAWRALALATALLAFLQGIAYAAIHYPFQGLPRDYDDALTWLDRHTERDAEVLSINPEVDLLIPAYTHDKVELGYYLSIVSDYPRTDNFRRLAGSLKALGADPSKYFRGVFLSTHSEEQNDVLNEGPRRGQIERPLLIWLYFHMHDRPREARSLFEEAARHPLPIKPDYLWFGRFEREFARKGPPSSWGGWREVYRNPSVTIYRATSPS